MGSDDGIYVDSISFWPNFLAKFISVSYVLLCFISAVQLIRTIINGHKIKSFRFGFLLLCFLWTLLRVIFYFFAQICCDGWKRWTIRALYFIPNSCQIATFSLLILFYAKNVYQYRWRETKNYYINGCLVVNVIMLILTCLFAGLLEFTTRNLDEQEQRDAEDALDEIYFITSAVFFGGLVVIALYFVRKLRSLRQSPGISKQEVLVTSLVFIIFFSRGVFDLLAAFNLHIFTHKITEVEDEDGRRVKLLAPSTFFLIFLWEIVPTLMVVVFFRPTSRVSTLERIKQWLRCIALKVCCRNQPNPNPVETEISGNDVNPVYESDLLSPNSFRSMQNIDVDRHSDLRDVNAESFEDNMRFDSDGWKRSTSYKQPLFGAESPI